MNMHTTNQFERLWALGYHRLCPITPPNCPVSERSGFAKRLLHGDDARGKAPGVRWPDGNWSGFDFVAHESTEADLVKWNGMGAGVGIKTGQGLVLIDADTQDEALAKIIRDQLATFGTLPPVRIGNYPKAGYLVLTDPDFQYTRIEFGERDAKGRLQERVEILSEGRQFVAHGIHPKTGQAYRWPDGVPPMAQLPYLSGDQLRAFLASLIPLLPAASAIVVEGSASEIDQATLVGDPELITKAVKATPNTSEHFPTRESYTKFGYAIKAALPDDPDLAFELYSDWCSRWAEGENEQDIVEADWNRFKPPYKVGASFLYDTAQTLAPETFNKAEQWFEHVQISEALFPEESSPNAFKIFDFLRIKEAAETALSSSAAPLIKGLLDQGAMTVLYGASNSGKTFVAMDIAYHVATGAPWGGMKVTRFPVLYVAAEGGQGAKKRAAALMAKYGVDADFYFLLHPVNLLRADADLEPLVRSIKAMGFSFGLIVIDTLSRAMAGGDENASTDMGAMVKHLDALRAASSAHLMVVHHTGKDATKGARGHSLLRAATDTEIEIVDSELAVMKQRDLDKSFSTGFGLDVVTLGADEDGDPITSCTVRLYNKEAPDATENLTKKFLDIVDAGEWRKDVRAGESWIGTAVAMAMGFDLETPADKARAKGMVRAWLAAGVLREEVRTSDARQSKVYVVRGYYDASVMVDTAPSCFD
jgi:hypothetical protein